MMLRPAINDLLEKISTKEHIGTRYELVIGVSKRARDINESDSVKITEANCVSNAVKEIDNGTVNVYIPEEEREKDQEQE